MPDLDTRYRALLRTPGPDLWDDIRTREPRAFPPAGRTRGNRIAAAVLALVAAVAGLALAVRAFGPARGPNPALTPSAIDAQVVATIQVGPVGQVTDVLAAGGSVWVTAYAVETEQDHLLRRIDPSTNTIVADIPLEGTPGWVTGGGGMAFGWDSIWVTGIRSIGEGREAILQRVDPSTNRIVATIPLFGTSSGDVSVSQTGVWVASSSEQRSELARIDPSTNRIVATVPLTEAYVRRVVALDTAVVIEEKAWPDGAGPETVVETVDPRTNEVLATTPPGVWGEGGEIVRWADQVWATSAGGGFRRADALTGSPEGGAVAQSADPCCMLLVAGDQGIWFFDNGELTVVDPRTGELRVGPPLTDFPPRAAATTADSVWLLSTDGRLARIDLG